MNHIIQVDSIVTSTSKINFHTDIRLDSIIISIIHNNEFKVFKKIEFDYSSIDRLTGLTTEYNENFNTDNIDTVWIKKDHGYTFDYRGGLATDAHDYWGYANGKTNYLDTLSSFDAVESRIFNLRKITFPKGNSIEYEFELNEYGTVDGVGLRVSKTIEKDEHNNKTSLTEYEYEGGILSTSALLSNSFNFHIKFGENISTGYLNSSSSSPFSLGASYVQYSKVTEYMGGKQEGTDKGINGKIEYTFKNENSVEYNIASDYPDIRDDLFEDNGVFTDTDYNVYKKYYDNLGRFVSFEYNFPYQLLMPKSDINGLLEKTIVFDKLNNKLSETENKYNITESTASVGLHLYNYYPPYTSCYQGQNGPDFTTEYYGIAFYKVFDTKIKLDSTINRVYKKDDGTNFVKSITTYTYDEDSNGDLIINAPVSKTETLSTGETVRTVYYYPHDLKNQYPVINEMYNRNIKSLVLKTETFKNNQIRSGANTVYRYKDVNNRQIIVPDYAQILEAWNYKTVKWFDEYTDKVNLIESHGIDGINKAVLLGYNETLPIASVVNAEHKNVFYTSFEEDEGTNIVNNDAKTGNKSYSGSYTFNSPQYTGTCILSYWKKVADNWEYVEQEMELPFSPHLTIDDGQIDEVRLLPVNAYISTSTYTPGIGKTSETDANGISVYYEYDAYGRMIKVYDQDKNLIKENKYNTATIDQLFLNPLTYTIESLDLKHKITVHALASGGTTPYQYNWFVDGTHFPGDETLSFIRLGSHQYNIVCSVIDAHGDTVSKSITVITED